MATIEGQRAAFTWSLAQYVLADNDDARALIAMRLAKIIKRAPKFGFTIDQVTQKQAYPVAEVARYLEQAGADTGPDLPESQALEALQAAVDTADVIRVGEGPATLYAYGYRSAPDRLRIAWTDGETVERIVAQIGAGTPDRPALLLEIRTHNCAALERAIHATLDYRNSRVAGSGKDWFTTSVDEVVSIYCSVAERSVTQPETQEPAAPPEPAVRRQKAQPEAAAA